jgi:hypothetical protein
MGKRRKSWPTVQLKLRTSDLKGGWDNHNQTSEQLRLFEEHGGPHRDQTPSLDASRRQGKTAMESRKVVVASC